MSNLQVEVKQRYKSSTRIDGQLNESKTFIDNFILHGTAINVLDTISRDYEGSDQRAYSITGPYGSGKSTIALFMSLLLSTNKNNREYALDSLNNAEDLRSEFSKRFKVSKGWRFVKHVCAIESPAHSLLSSIADSLKVKINTSDLANFSDNECLQQIKKLLNSSSIKEDGIFILLDEMGKALDYCSSENKDLYIFQQLADIAQQSKNNVVLIGFLHQPFTEYAKNKGVKQQEDWAKVQGRYRDLGYNPSVDESLVLIGDAISKISKNINSKLEEKHKNLVTTVDSNFESKTRGASNLLKALPIDPLVSLLLGPISRRSFSQNERSLFGFLTSHEKYGFKEFLNENYSTGKDVCPLYTTDNLWEYLHHNLYHTISTSQDSKVWLEACDAVERAKKIDGGLPTSIAKVVSLLTLFGFHHHFHATKAFIEEYFSYHGFNCDNVDAALANLSDNGVVIFRPWHNGYFIFEGSDVDVNKLIKNQKVKILSGVDWTSVCKTDESILATSHYHKTGTMRWAKKHIVNTIDTRLVEQLQAEAVHGEVFLNFIIPISSESRKQLEALQLGSKNIVIGESSLINKLKDNAIELIALLQTKKELVVNEKIAHEELDLRITMFQQSLSRKLNHVFNTASWNHNGTIISGRPLSSISSSIAGKIFSRAPVLVNELVNKSKPSGSANSAIKKLIKAMTEKDIAKNLGFSGSTFPAEKGLFYSCLESYGLHVEKENGSFGFVMPNKDQELLYSLFESTLKFIKMNDRIVRMSEVIKIWSHEPYGLAKGVIPIWLMAFLQANKTTLAFYDYNEVTTQATFIDGADNEFAMRMLQLPEMVGVQYIQTDVTFTKYLNELAFPFKDELIQQTPLAIAQVYISFYSRLSNWTKNTKTLHPELVRFMEAAKKTSDPNDFLIKKIPEIFADRKVVKDTSNITGKDMEAIIKNLEGVHSKLLLRFKDKIEDYINLSEQLISTCKDVIRYTSNPKVKTFAMRLSKFDDGVTWITAIISLLSGKAERSWDDSSIERAESELIEVIERFKIDSYLADFGGFNFKDVNTNFKANLNDVNAQISELKHREKKAVLMTLLDTLIESEDLKNDG